MFGEVDDRLPHTVITVMEPVRLHTLRHATLPPGEYKIQGDARNRFRGVRERRLIGTKIDIRFDPGDAEYQQGLRQIVSAQTQSGPTEVGPDKLQEPEAVDAPVGAAVAGDTTELVPPEVTTEAAMASPKPISVTDAVMTEEMQVPPPPPPVEEAPAEEAKEPEEKPKKKRGRPKGSKNKPKDKPKDEKKEEAPKKRGRPPKALPDVDVPGEAIPRRRSRTRSAI